MPEEGAAAPAPANRQQPPRRAGGGKKKKGNQRSTAPNKTFKGDCLELSGTIFEVNASSSGTFNQVIRKVSEHFARTEDNAGEFRIAMETQEYVSLAEPADPSDTDLASPRKAVVLAKWKTQYETYKIKLKRRKALEMKAFALVLGQCTEEIRGRLKGSPTWDIVNTSYDLMALLKLIQSYMSIKKTKRYTPMVILESKIDIFNYRQSEHMSNQTYHDNLLDRVERAESMNSGIGTDLKRIHAILDANGVPDPSVASENELSTAREIYRQEIMAVLLIRNSDQHRYSHLKRDMDNGYTLGNDVYPRSLTAALDLLNNWVKPQKWKKGARDSDVEHSYHSEEHPRQPNRGRGGGRGGGRGSGGNRGGGRGRGRGRDQSNRRENDEHEHGDQPENYQADEEQEDTSVDDNASTGSSYFDSESFASLGRRLEGCFQTMDKKNMDRKRVLLDSCSTVNLFADRSLVHGIHRANIPMRIRTYGGIKSTNLRAYVGNFPEAVWYDPTGVANIMSLALVKEYYRVSYDSESDNAFYIHLPNGDRLRFAETSNGLYAYCALNPRPYREAWTFIQTVEDQRKKFTKRQNTLADRA